MYEYCYIINLMRTQALAFYVSRGVCRAANDDFPNRQDVVRAVSG